MTRGRMQNRWGTTDGKPGKLKEFDLRWDCQAQSIFIVRTCYKCRRPVLLPWTAKTASRKANMVCSRCRKP